MKKSKDHSELLSQSISANCRWGLVQQNGKAHAECPGYMVKGTTKVQCLCYHHTANKKDT